MSCKNYVKGGSGLTCTISPIAFDCLQVNQYFVAVFALVQGVVDHGGIPMIMYHHWIGSSCNKNKTMSEIVLEFTSPIDFAKMYFDTKPQYHPIERCHIDYLNQFSGTTISG